MDSAGTSNPWSKPSYARIGDAEEPHDTPLYINEDDAGFRRSHESFNQGFNSNREHDIESSSINHANGHTDTRNRTESWSWKEQPDDILLTAPEATAGLPEYSGDVSKQGNLAFMRKAGINVLLITLWYLFSVSISVYNKWMFADKDLDFHFPLFTTSLHMVVQFLLASTVLLLVPRFRPRHGAPDPHAPGAEPAEPVDPKKPIMTPSFYVTKIAPCASATGLDIGLGNTSLKYVTLTFFTMCKSSTLGFVLAFAIIFKLEKMSWKLAGIIAVMTLGVIMMVAGETAFSVLGFVLLMLASFFSGLRWSLTQMLLRRNPATSNPFSSLFFLTPIMFVVILILAFPVEGFGSMRAGLDNLAERKGRGMTFLILLAPGLLAFCMTSAEFALLKRTSVVTLSVCGIFKEVITIAAGGLIFDDRLTPINISGLVVTIVAIAAYNYIRVKRMQQKEVEKAHEIQAGEHAPMLDAAAPPGQDPAYPETRRSFQREDGIAMEHARQPLAKSVEHQD